MHVTEYMKRALFELAHKRPCKMKLQEVHRKEICFEREIFTDFWKVYFTL